MQNKRTYGRVPTIKAVSCTVAKRDTPDDIINVVVKNLSPGGILFESNRDFAMNAILDLEIRLPFAANDESGKVSGKVVHCQRNARTNRFEIGVAYIRPK